MQRRTFNQALATLAASAGLAHWQPAAAQEAGATALFNGRDLAGWDRIGNANWRVAGGAIVADQGNGMLVSKRPYADFVLHAEFWVDASTNSGIFIRAADPTTITATNAYEVNIWDERPEPNYGTGAIVGVAQVNPMPRAGGRWNTFDIIARGDSFTVVLNGLVTVNGARDAKHAGGRIALQHGDGVKDANGVVNDRGVVRFRKVEIRAL
jgi:hypothetical protein